MARRVPRCEGLFGWKNYAAASVATVKTFRKVTLAAMIGAILSVSRFSAHMFLIRIRPCRMSDLHLASNSG